MKRTIYLVSFLMCMFVTCMYAQHSHKTQLKAGKIKIENVSNKQQRKFYDAEQSLLKKSVATSDEVFQLPYSDDFSNEEHVRSSYTFVDANGDKDGENNIWGWNAGMQSVDYISNNDNVADDWVFTPLIHFDGKKKCVLTFQDMAMSPSDIRVTIGKTTNPDDQTEISFFPQVQNFWNEDKEVTFNVPEEGDYHIGFQICSAYSMYSIFELSVVAKDTYVPGTVFELPYFDDFADGDRTNAAYTFVDVDNDGHDNLNTWYWKEDEKLVQFCSDNQNPGNDWFITPAIHLDGQNLYDLAFTINAGAPSNLKVFLGTSTNPKDFTTEIIDLNGVHDEYQTEYNVSFKVPGDGKYYLGFYNYSNKESFYLNLFNIELKTGMEGTHPDKVSNLNAVSGDNGEMKATITFNAPETNIRGEKLEGTFPVDLFRNDELIMTFNATAGETIVYDDVEVPAGSNTYVVVARLDDLKSEPQEVTIWVGPDISEPVNNFNAKTTEDNMQVVLNWDAPTKGSHDGYFDAESLTYNVYRSYDGEEFDEIATGLSVLSYTDDQIEDELYGCQEAYFYAVSAVTVGGKSAPALKLVTVGTPYTIPETESFPNGRFNVSPWTTESVEGSFGWECIHSDEDVKPYDKDRGMIKFANTWGDVADSRLKGPVFDLTGSEHPTFSFQMMHWDESTILDDNRHTKCTIEVSVDGGDFEPVAEPIVAADVETGWKEHRLSLDKYKNAKKVQFGIRGYSDNNWMYYYVDGICFDEQKENDLAFDDFYGTKTAKMNEIASYTVKYHNRGLNEASDYTLDLYQDDEFVKSVKGETIKPGEYKTVTISHQMTAAKADDESDLHVVVNYSSDEEMNNNTTWKVSTEVSGSWYPTVENLQSEVSAVNGVDVVWEAPEIPNEPVVVNDGAEEFDSFSIEDFGDWTVIDGDKAGSGVPDDMPDFTNKNADMAFMVWAPEEINGMSFEAFPELIPRTGSKCFLAWYASTLSGTAVTVNNDDYLISPEVIGGTNVKFYVKRAGAVKEKETYEVMYSSTDTEASSFKVIESKVAGPDWELIEFTLPEDARYFAIHYTASLQMGIMIDDVEYTSAISALKLQGYNIFRNGQKINENIVNATSYNDVNVTEGKSYEYQVSAVYDRGESEAAVTYITIPTGIDNVMSDVTIETGENGIVINTDTELPVNVYTTDGCMLYSHNVNGRMFVPTVKDIYIVKVADKTVKVVVK